MEQVHGVLLSGHPVELEWNEAIERHAASVFCSSHDVLHRHRAPFETTRAKEPQPRSAALSAGCLSLTIRFRHRLRLLTCLTRHT
jgi:hypothetical protein